MTALETRQDGGRMASRGTGKQHTKGDAHPIDTQRHAMGFPGQNLTRNFDDKTQWSPMHFYIVEYSEDNVKVPVLSALLLLG